jgi:hypothetical protein
MKRITLTFTLAVALVLIVAGCGAAVVTSSSGASESSTLPAATTTSVGVSAADTTSTGDGASSPSVTGPAGSMAFSEYAKRFGDLLDALKTPGTLPFSVLTADQVTPLFGSLALVVPTDAQGFRLANGDIVVLFGATSIHDVGGQDMSTAEAEQELVKAFTSAYGGDGREVVSFVNGGTVAALDFGYLVASKNDAKKLGMMALDTREAPTLDDVITQFQEK